MPGSVIYLLRHGETVWNVEGRIQGALDSVLTSRGCDQARRMGAILSRVIDDFSGFSFQVSPLGRTRETASLIAQQIPLEPVIQSSIAEVSLGSWDGLTRDEISVRYPGSLDGASPHDWYFRSPDGETLEQASARARNWLDGIGGPVIAVSHGLVGRLIRGCYLGLTREEMLKLPASQDGLLRLQDGTAELLA